MGQGLSLSEGELKIRRGDAAEYTGCLSGMQERSFLWLTLLLLAALAIFFWHTGRIHAPELSDDSFQYLGAARNWLEHGSFSTWVAHFDEQVAVRRFPVPLTHFAVGYPAAVGALAFFGVPIPMAGLFWSALAYIFGGWLVWLAGLELKLAKWLAAALALTWLLNSFSLGYGVTAGTDSVFSFLTLALVYCIFVELGQENPRGALLLTIGFLAGAAYLVRYAGLFLLPSAGLYLAQRGWRDRRRRVWSAGGIAAAGALFAVGALRNVLLTGSWRGFTSQAHQDLRTVAGETAKSAFHITFGGGVTAKFDFWMALFAIGAVATAVLCWPALRRARAAWPSLSPVAQRLAWMGLLSALYAGGVFAAALTVTATDLARYYFPLYAFGLLAAGAALQAAGPRRTPFLAAACLVSVLAVHARTLVREPGAQASVGMNATMEQEVAPGISVRSWIASHTTPGEPLFATDGQVVQYVLDRPVVSIIEPAQSMRRWDADCVRSLMTAYHSKLILLFPHAVAMPEQEWPFLREVLRGNLPDWLRPAAQSREVILLECASCGAPK